MPIVALEKYQRW
jgi:acyl-homoserine-lactone acylase